MANLRAAIILHDDHLYLDAVLQSLRDVPCTIFVSRTSWGEQPAGDWQSSVTKAEAAGAASVVGDWSDESSHRRAVVEWARQSNIAHLIIPDSDEILSPGLLDTLKRIAEVDLADAVYCTMDTYWKSPEYVVTPRERLMPVIMISPSTVAHDYIRSYTSIRPLMISEAHGVLHHLSYSGPDARIVRKLASWSHKDEVVPNWWREVWLKWNRHRNLRDIHPTHPPAYGRADRRPCPAELELALMNYLEACGGDDPLRPARPSLPSSLPKVSVIIPLYGGVDDIRACLSSLAASIDLLHEVLVVDDCSPDDAPEVAREFDFCKVIGQPSNKGFASTCNLGADHATGDILLFLNSDTIVPRVGLEEMLRVLVQSEIIGAVGPVSNNVGHDQMIPCNYSDPDHITHFAEDIAGGDAPDTDVDMLVGFCLAVRRSAWKEVGPFDESFAVGMFEDNDLCYRLRRAGYRLVIAQKAFVHHRGHASLDRADVDKAALLTQNLARYKAKWREDLDSGFSSTLSGLGPDRIDFRHGLKPELRRSQAAEAAKQANISLCMIVKNEERVLADCLITAQPFFSQIVVVDTGSTDRTVDIAKSFGAEVIEIEWPRSFAEARNVSLKHATGDWVCWLDADDTFPLVTGEAMLQAVLAAPPQLGGLVMSVRFVNDDEEFGTSVDHVKVFRNHQEFEFEGRIHEQILPSIRAKGFEVARLPVDVLHSGYDTSEEGQARKRARDAELLKLDLEDRPDHPFVLFNLGMTSHFNGEHEEAIDWLEKSIAEADPAESQVRKAYALLTVSVRESRGDAEAMAVCQRGLAETPDDAELLFHSAILHTRAGDLEQAAQAYVHVLEVGRGAHFSSVDRGIYSFKTLHNLGIVYAEMGNFGAAVNRLQAAIQANPRYDESIHALFRLAMSNGDKALGEWCLSRLEISVGAWHADYGTMARHLERM